MRFLTQKSNQVIDITTTVTGRLMFALCCICLPGFLAIPGMAQAQAFEWPQVDPELAGIEQSAIASLDAATRRGDYGNVNSLLVLRHGKLVYEGYFNGHGRDDLMPLYSVTKSWASALIGIAVMRGDIEGVNQPLQDILTQYSAAFQAQPDKQSIRIRDLLTMRHGLDWDEWSTWFTDPVNPVNQMTRASDWWAFVLNRPMTAQVDSVFRYSTGASNLLGAVLWKVSNQSALDYARDHLFDPLDIDDSYIEVDLSGAPRGSGITSFQTGLTPTGHGLWLKPRDLAKIGQLYLDRGVWQGQRILPSSWIDESWAPHTNSNTDPDLFPDGVSYGYQWWGFRIDSPDGPLQVQLADGWADQYIMIIPALDLVVVSNASNGAYDGPDMRTALRNVIVPAVDSGFDPVNDAGLTGSWYSRTLQHQGFMLEIVPTTGQIVIYWMTFEPETGNQQWMIAVGRLSGRRALLEYLRPIDGSFVGTDPANLTTWGEGELIFQSCTRAAMSYRSADGSAEGIINLDRLTPNVYCHQ
jgi:CubicO group peptidase (beta-lactamase class C family)